MKARFLTLQKWLVAVLPVIALIIGCNGDSAESLSREIGIDISGYYANNGGNLAGNQTGNPVTGFDVRQQGAKLEAVDSNGILFKGSIDAVADQYPFTLNGETTIGQKVTISGNFNVNGTSSAMQGTWIEDSLTGSFYAMATIPDQTQEEPEEEGRDVNDTGDWTGCCSDHDGIQTDTNGVVQLNSEGYALCNDGTSSPGCNVNDRL